MIKEFEQDEHNQMCSTRLAEEFKQLREENVSIGRQTGTNKSVHPPLVLQGKRDVNKLALQRFSCLNTRLAHEYLDKNLFLLKVD